MAAFNDTETQTRHRDYLDECAQIRATWQKRVAHRAGPLPGALLDPIRTPHGWCGQVQLVPGLHSISDVHDAAETIAGVYGLPAGAVYVADGIDDTADTAFVWAYRCPSGADYHEQWPATVSGRPFAGDLSVVGRPTRFDWAELGEWAYKYRHSWDRMREPGTVVDVAGFVRRLVRLRAGIVDVLPQAQPGEVRQLLDEQGVTAAMLPDDLAELAGLTKEPAA